MDTYLYLLEVFVETLKFSSNVNKKPTESSQIVIYADVGKFLELEIVAMKMTKGKKAVPEYPKS